VARGKTREALAEMRNDGSIGRLYRGVILYLDPNAATRDEMLEMRDKLIAPSERQRDSTLRTMSYYVAGLLDISLGDTAAAKREAAQLGNGHGSPDVARVSRLLSAEIARSAGNPARALTILGKPEPEGSRAPAGFAFPLAHDRFLRGELLRELHRPGESLRWYSTFPDPGGYDLMYLGKATQRVAESYAAFGNRAAAERFNSRLVLLRRDSDPALKGGSR
jgi:hypothetical protein